MKLEDLREKPPVLSETVAVVLIFVFLYILYNSKAAVRRKGGSQSCTCYKVQELATHIPESTCNFTQGIAQNIDNFQSQLINTTINAVINIHVPLM